MGVFCDIETERLLLRCVSRGDREFLYKQFSDDDVNRYLFDAEPFTRLSDADELIDFYTAPEPRDRHRWVLVLKESGESVGTCGFHRWDRQKGSAEMGYDLQPAFWGKGLMTEALRAIIDFANNNMAIRRIDAHIYEGNEKSIAIATRLGFTDSGEKEALIFHDREYIHKIYRLEAKA